MDGKRAENRRKDFENDRQTTKNKGVSPLFLGKTWHGRFLTPPGVDQYWRSRYTVPKPVSAMSCSHGWGGVFRAIHSMARAASPFATADSSGRASLATLFLPGRVRPDFP